MMSDNMMKRTHLPYQLIIFFSLATTSCTKVIDLKLGNDTGKLVIEGNITNVNGPQYIRLSQNAPFYNTNTYPPITGATIAVHDQVGNNYTFTEGPPGTYSINSLTGIIGNTYTVNILANGKSYTAHSTMPTLVVLDTITSKPSLLNGSKRTITVHYQDPPKIANQYRFVMYVNGVQVNNFFTFNDMFTDGRYVNVDIVENDIDIYPGSTVTVEMQCIDQLTYTYWYTLATQSANGAGGGVAPSNPPNNITPLTLGYFSAHTSQSKTIVVQ